MKKILSVILSLSLCISMTACKTQTELPVQSGSADQTSQTHTIISDRSLLDQLKKWVENAQPGTAGSSLKAVVAAKDVLDWAEKNISDKETLIVTVKDFFENYEYKDEALQAFRSIRYVFDVLNSDTGATLLNSAGFKAEDFNLNDETVKRINELFDIIEEYAQ